MFLNPNFLDRLLGVSISFSLLAQAILQQHLPDNRMAAVGNFFPSSLLGYLQSEGTTFSIKSEVGVEGQKWGHYRA